jgi:hypothetical protein
MGGIYRRPPGRVIMKRGFLLALFLCPALLPAVPAPADTVTCKITIDDFEILSGHRGQEIIVEDFGSLQAPGKPKLPGKIFAVAIPPHTRMTSVTIDAGEAILLPGRYRVMPTPLFRVLGREKPACLAKDRKTWQANHDAVYQSDTPYPGQAGAFVRTAAYRKYNLVDVRITPFQYRPRSGKLSYHPVVRINVEYEYISTGYNLPLVDFHPETERTAEEIILNYMEAQGWYPAGPGGGEKALTDFVIITREELVDAVSPLVAWEEAKGRHCEVVTVDWIGQRYDGPDRAAKIRAFLRDKYPTSAWGICDVLLVGNHNQVNMRLAWANIPGYDRPRTDFYYAELSFSDEASWDRNGDGRYGEPGIDAVDFYSEVNVGRIPWSDAATVRHICEKSVAYEQNDDPAFKKNMLLLGAFFWADTDTAKLMEAKASQPWMSAWTTTRMYEKNADFSSEYPCDYELLHENVMDQWSNGTFAFVNWAGHGYPRSSLILGLGMPAFISSSDCPSLNDDYPAIIFGDSCSNCSSFFNIGRDMLKQGAVGFVGATEVACGCHGWDDPSDGSSQSLDYWFTTGVTSGEYTQGASHQRALRKLYTDGGWKYPEYEMYEWSLWGNPDLGLNYTGAPEPIALVAAPGPWESNPSDVRVFDVNEVTFPLTEIRAYQTDRFGVNASLGELDRDGEPEILTGPGPGPMFGPHVRAFEINGDMIDGVNFIAYGTKKFGVKAAAADVDGDGCDEILTGPGPAAVFGPHVRGWNYDGQTVLPIQGINFFAYGCRHFGVNPAGGDLDGDGTDEIITGAGPGIMFGPHVRGWQFDGQAITPMSSVSFFAYQARHFGVNVSGGDIAGGTHDEIITGPGPGPELGTHVRAFTCESGKAQAIPGVDFMAYPESRCGVIVAAGQADGEGKSEIITGPGPAWENKSRVRGWLYNGDTIIPSPVIDFFAFKHQPGNHCGVNVAVGR